MIDVIVSDTGTLMIAHDAGELDIVSQIRVYETDRKIRVLVGEGEEQDIGVLTPAMLEKALSSIHGSVTSLDGWNSNPPYDCPITIIRATNN